MYYPHPNIELLRAFQERPYQGATPEDAKYLFVGLDANYDCKIEKNKAFPQIIEYLKDGVTFWQKNGVHHPFLLPSYQGDGKFYHKSFARIGLDKSYAEEVSFIELVDVPTYGKSSLCIEDLNVEHLKWIKCVIECGNAKYVFLPTTVGNLMKKSGLFPWLLFNPKKTESSLKSWGSVGSTELLWHYHFSVYGKFEEKKSRQLAEIKRLADGGIYGAEITCVRCRRNNI